MVSRGQATGRGRFRLHGELVSSSVLRRVRTSTSAASTNTMVSRGSSGIEVVDAQASLGICSNVRPYRRCVPRRTRWSRLRRRGRRRDAACPSSLWSRSSRPWRHVQGVRRVAGPGEGALRRHVGEVLGGGTARGLRARRIDLRAARGCLRAREGASLPASQRCPSSSRRRRSPVKRRPRGAAWGRGRGPGGARSGRVSTDALDGLAHKHACDPRTPGAGDAAPRARQPRGRGRQPGVRIARRDGAMAAVRSGRDAPSASPGRGAAAGVFRERGARGVTDAPRAPGGARGAALR